MTNSIISGIVATFDRDNIDTDQIIPTEYLKSIKKFGFGDFLFDGWRYLDEGRLDMTSEDRSKNYDFILNKEPFANAQQSRWDKDQGSPQPQATDHQT